MSKAIRHTLTITNFRIDRPAPLEINHKIATMGGGDSHRVKISASLCSAFIRFLGVFCASEKVGLPTEKKLLAGRLGLDPLMLWSILNKYELPIPICIIWVPTIDDGCRFGHHFQRRARDSSKTRVEVELNL